MIRTEEIAAMFASWIMVLRFPRSASAAIDLSGRALVVMALAFTGALLSLASRVATGRLYASSQENIVRRASAWNPPE